MPLAACWWPYPAVAGNERASPSRPNPAGFFTWVHTLDEGFGATWDFVPVCIGIGVVTDPLCAAQVSENMSLTVWGALFEYALDHWMVLAVVMLVMVVAVIYVITKD